MKRARKGFTLVELLIVIAIIGTLAAAMSMSAGRATASAKASTIISNIEACKTATSMYLADNYGADLSATTADAFLKEHSAYIPNFGDFSTNGIKFTVLDGKGYKNWGIKVDFKNEADVEGIASALSKTKGYKAIYDEEEGYFMAFTVRLYSGEVYTSTTLGKDSVVEPSSPATVTTGS